MITPIEVGYLEHQLSISYTVQISYQYYINCPTSVEYIYHHLILTYEEGYDKGIFLGFWY